MNRHLLALAGALACCRRPCAGHPAARRNRHPASGRQPGARARPSASCAIRWTTCPPSRPCRWASGRPRSRRWSPSGAPIAPDQAQLIIQYLNQATPPRRRPPPQVGRTRKAGRARPARHAGVRLSAYHWATPARGTAGAILEARMLQPVSANTDLPPSRAARPALRVSTLSPCPSRRSGSSGSPTCSPTWAPGRSPSPRPGSSPPNRAARCWSP